MLHLVSDKSKELMKELYQDLCSSPPQTKHMKDWMTYTLISVLVIYFYN